jgi:hypothetical protein
MIITDLNMPRMDGLTMIREIRKSSMQAGVPIIFLTTESDDAKGRGRPPAPPAGWSSRSTPTNWCASPARCWAGERQRSGCRLPRRGRRPARPGGARAARSGQRPGNRALVDEVFRGLHTLKGSGAMFGFDALAGFTHHCETAFDRVRKGKAQASQALIRVILSARDHMQALIDAGTGRAGLARGDAILAALHEAVAKAKARRPREPAAQGGWHITFRCPQARWPMAPTRCRCWMNCASLALPTARLDELPPWPKWFPPNAISSGTWC